MSVLWPFVIWIDDYRKNDLRQEANIDDRHLTKKYPLGKLD